VAADDDDEEEEVVPRPRRRRRILAVAGGLLVLAALVVAVAGWVLSGFLIDPHHDLQETDVQVAFVADGHVVMERTEASDHDGTYGLTWKGGHAVVGPISARTADTITRPLRDVRGTLRAGTDVALDPDVWEGDPATALGVPFRDVPVPDPLGPMPAWQVAPGDDPARPRGATWAIFVHGIDGARIAGLRALPTLRRAGLPSLLVSYRNDVGAPASPDGKIHLGMTEWQDLEAAARYAVRHGARRLILYGQSMGGTIVTRFMHRSPLASRVAGIVLDAPVLDWESVIGRQARRFHVPFMAGLVEATIGLRIDVDWAALDELDQAGTFHVPILILQGLDDPLVPPADGRAFAAAVPDGLATFVGFPRAGHIQSWNADPARYDRTLAAFLRRVSGG